MNRNRLVLNMQQFATQTTLLNATGNDLSPEMKTYYAKELVRLAEPELVHDQFGQKKPIPANGGKNIEFRKFDSLPKATTPLTEGVTPAGNKLNVSVIPATVSQYGDYIEVSDVLKLTAIDNVILESLTLLGSQAGKTMDTITRDVLAGGTNVIYADENKVGNDLRTSLTAADVLKPIYFFKAATQLAAMNAPKIDGSYVAIIHPYAKYDLITSDEWVDVNKYTTSDKIFNGEIGKIGNVRFVESTEAKIWKDSSCPTDSDGDPLAVFSTLVLGADAYGVTEVTGGGLETIVKQLGAGQDPLNQRATVGWKGIKTAERLVEQYMVRVESLSAYSADAVAN